MALGSLPLGMCHVKASFDAKAVELIVSTFQAACLLLFNEAESLTYAEVRDRLNLPDDDVMRSLHSLSCAKYKILSKTPEGKTISEGDTVGLCASSIQLIPIA